MIPKIILILAEIKLNKMFCALQASTCWKAISVIQGFCDQKDDVVCQISDYSQILFLIFSKFKRTDFCSPWNHSKWNLATNP